MKTLGRLLSTACAMLCTVVGAPAQGLRTEHPSLGVCTRAEEFELRQVACDELVSALRSGLDKPAEKAALAALEKAIDRDVECLIRYREPKLAPIFEKLVGEGGRPWFFRTRAAYALKMLGQQSSVKALTKALEDAEPIVRDAAATALGHLGGPDAAAALEKRKAKEKEPYALAALEASLALARAESRPYEQRADGKRWQEPLVGPEGARRVEFVWRAKGQSSFNDYDAKTLEYPTAERFVYPIQRYREDLFGGYPRRSFAANGNHAGEDQGWFREGTSYFAVADGIVRMVQGAGGDWGFLVAIEHRLADGSYLTSVYGHAAFDVQVRAGEIVRCGQRIATMGLSCSLENGGYGAHLHFGFGAGPFRRPAGLAAGDFANLQDEQGNAQKTEVLRLVYAAEKKGQHGWPLTAFVVRLPSGEEKTIEVPEQPVGREIGWFQAYVKDCRGWRDPQTLLPELVEGAKR
jgi:murein DD-endopeptidase MepM/ murein hydrolase activator NlpD